MTQHATTATVAADPAGTPPAGATTRRRVLATSGVVAAAAVVTAACGSSDPSSTTGGAAATPSGASPGGATSGGAALAAADVPVGGGVILRDAKVVITQPAAGTFKGFSAVCTHQGCVVSSVSDGAINCACHGSVFSADDGSVESGPATSPLAPVNVTVSGDQITVA